mgnify:CR=1 FL=1
MTYNTRIYNYANLHSKDKQIVQAQLLMLESVEDTITNYTYAKETSTNTLETISFEEGINALEEAKRNMYNDIVEYMIFAIDSYEDEVKEIEDEITVYELLMQKGGEKGFALVVGDKRIPDVLAYSEYGSLDDTLSNLALKYYFRTIPEYVSKRLEGCLKNSKDVCQTKAEDPTKDSYMHVCNLIVEWGQNSPYNNKTPYTCSTLDASYGGRAPAGCGPVAIAQLISFYRFPASYNWDLLLSTPTVSINDSEVKKNEISTLMYNLGQDMSTWYDCDGSSTAVNSMVATLRNYGYTVSEGPFGVLGIDAEMRQDRPILMTGVCDEGGHAWLITGYKYNVLLHPTGQYVKTYYCNMNWGWNGSSNGFYLVCTAPLNQSGGEMNPILPFGRSSSYEFNRNLRNFFVRK